MIAISVGQPGRVGIDRQAADPVDHRVDPVAGQPQGLAAQAPRAPRTARARRHVRLPSSRKPQWLRIRVCSASRVRSQTARSRHGEPHHAARRPGRCQLTGERGMPVVPVGQHQDLPVVADLEQLLGASMHCADHDLGPRDHPVLGPQPKLDQPGVAGMIRPQVEQDGPGRRLGPSPSAARPAPANPTSTRSGSAINLPHSPPSPSPLLRFRTQRPILALRSGYFRRAA